MHTYDHIRGVHIEHINLAIEDVVIISSFIIHVRFLVEYVRNVVMYVYVWFLDAAGSHCLNTQILSWNIKRKIVVLTQ